MHRNEVQGTVTKVVNINCNFKTSDNNSSKSESYPTSGGIFSDFELAWLYYGSVLKIVNISDGMLQSSWDFNSITHQDTEITCVIEYPINDCVNKMGKENQVCIIVSYSVKKDSNKLSFISFCHPRTSRILHTITIKEMVTYLSLITARKDHSSPLTGPVKVMSGALAIGTKTGNLLIIDIKSYDLITEMYSCVRRSSSSESQNRVSDSLVLSLKENSESEIKEQICKIDNDSYHVAVSLSDKKDSHHYNEICAISYIHEGATLAVGFKSGIFQLWDVCSLKLLYKSSSLRKATPVAKFGFQEPCNDPQNVCYLWVIYQADYHDSCLPFATMYGILYRKVSTIPEYGRYYKSFSHCKKRFDLDMDMERCIAGRCITCSVVSNTPSNMLRHINTIDTDSSKINLFTMVFETWERETDLESHISLVVFDMNQWYKAQMPDQCYHSYAIPFVNFLMLESVSELKSSALDMRIKKDTIQQFLTFNLSEEYSNPSSLSFDTYFLTDTKVMHLRVPGAQRNVLEKIISEGPLCLINPSKYFTDCKDTGLGPCFSDPYNHSIVPTQLQQRNFILTILLEHKMSTFLARCAKQWADGSRAVSGCTLPNLIQWAWDCVTRIKRLTDIICVPLFDYSGDDLDRENYHKLKHCCQLLHIVRDLLLYISKNYKQYLMEEINLNHQIQTLRLVTKYFDVIVWCLDCGLLPEKVVSSTERCIPTYMMNLMQFSEQRREELKTIGNKNKYFITDNSTLYIIDSVLQTDKLGKKLCESWERESYGLSDGSYPPVTLQSLLRMFLMPNLSQKTKHFIMLYFLMDVCDYHRDEDMKEQLLSFSTVFSIDMKFFALVEVCWLIDHEKFEEAADLLFIGSVITELRNEPELYKTILLACVSQNQYALALKCERIVRLTLSVFNGHKFFITLLLFNGLTMEAYMSLKEIYFHKKEVLRHFFKVCNELGFLKQIFKFPLTTDEEEEFMLYLDDCPNKNSNDFKVMYLLSRNRYVEAIELNQQLNTVMPKYNVVGQNTTKKEPGIGRTTTTDLFVNAFSKTLPTVTNELIDVCRKEKDRIYRWKQTKRPTPLSVIVHTENSQQIPMYKSSFESVLQAVITKTAETWSSFPSIDANKNFSSLLKNTPFLRTNIVTPKSKNLNVSFTNNDLITEKINSERKRKLDKDEPPLKKKRSDVDNSICNNDSVEEESFVPLEISRILYTPHIQKRLNKLMENTPESSPLTSILKSSEVSRFKQPQKVEFNVPSEQEQRRRSLRKSVINETRRIDIPIKMEEIRNAKKSLADQFEESPTQKSALTVAEMIKNDKSPSKKRALSDTSLNNSSNSSELMDSYYSLENDSDNDLKILSVENMRTNQDNLQQQQQSYSQRNTTLIIECMSDDEPLTPKQQLMECMSDEDVLQEPVMLMKSTNKPSLFKETTNAPSSLEKMEYMSDEDVLQNPVALVKAADKPSLFSSRLTEMTNAAYNLKKQVSSSPIISHTNLKPDVPLTKAYEENYNQSRVKQSCITMPVIESVTSMSISSSFSKKPVIEQISRNYNSQQQEQQQKYQSEKTTEVTASQNQPYKGDSKIHLSTLKSFTSKNANDDMGIAEPTASTVPSWNRLSNVTVTSGCSKASGYSISDDFMFKKSKLPSTEWNAVKNEGTAVDVINDKNMGLSVIQKQQYPVTDINNLCSTAEEDSDIEIVEDSSSLSAVRNTSFNSKSIEDVTTEEDEYYDEKNSEKSYESDSNNHSRGSVYAVEEEQDRENELSDDNEGEEEIEDGYDEEIDEEEDEEENIIKKKMKTVENKNQQLDSTEEIEEEADEEISTEADNESNVEEEEETEIEDDLEEEEEEEGEEEEVEVDEEDEEDDDSGEYGDQNNKNDKNVQEQNPNDRLQKQSNEEVPFDVNAQIDYEQLHKIVSSIRAAEESNALSAIDQIITAETENALNAPVFSASQGPFEIYDDITPSVIEETVNIDYLSDGSSEAEYISNVKKFNAHSKDNNSIHLDSSSDESLDIPEVIDNDEKMDVDPHDYSSCDEPLKTESITVVKEATNNAIEPVPTSNMKKEILNLNENQKSTEQRDEILVDINDQIKEIEQHSTETKSQDSEKKVIPEDKHIKPEEPQLVFFFGESSVASISDDVLSNSKSIILDDELVQPSSDKELTDSKTNHKAVEGSESLSHHTYNITNNNILHSTVSLKNQSAEVTKTITEEHNKKLSNDVTPESQTVVPELLSTEQSISISKLTSSPNNVAESFYNENQSYTVQVLEATDPYLYKSTVENNLITETSVLPHTSNLAISETISNLCESVEIMSGSSYCEEITPLKPSPTNKMYTDQTSKRTNDHNLSSNISHQHSVISTKQEHVVSDIHIDMPPSSSDSQLIESSEFSHSPKSVTSNNSLSLEIVDDDDDVEAISHAHQPALAQNIHQDDVDIMQNNILKAVQSSELVSEISVKINDVTSAQDNKLIENNISVSCQDNKLIENNILVPSNESNKLLTTLSTLDDQNLRDQHFKIPTKNTQVIDITSFEKTLVPDTLPAKVEPVAFLTEDMIPPHLSSKVESISSIIVTNELTNSSLNKSFIDSETYKNTSKPAQVVDISLQSVLHCSPQKILDNQSLSPENEQKSLSDAIIHQSAVNLATKTENIATSSNSADEVILQQQNLEAKNINTSSQLTKIIAISDPVSTVLHDNMADSSPFQSSRRYSERIAQRRSVDREVSSRESTPIKPKSSYSRRSARFSAHQIDQDDDVVSIKSGSSIAESVSSKVSVESGFSALSNRSTGNQKRSRLDLRKSTGKHQFKSLEIIHSDEEALPESPQSETTSEKGRKSSRKSKRKHVTNDEEKDSVKSDVIETGYVPKKKRQILMDMATNEAAAVVTPEMDKPKRIRTIVCSTPIETVPDMADAVQKYASTRKLTRYQKSLMEQNFMTKSKKTFEDDNNKNRDDRGTVIAVVENYDMVNNTLIPENDFIDEAKLMSPSSSVTTKRKEKAQPEKIVSAELRKRRSTAKSRNIKNKRDNSADKSDDDSSAESTSSKTSTASSRRSTRSTSRFKSYSSMEIRKSSIKHYFRPLSVIPSDDESSFQQPATTANNEVADEETGMSSSESIMSKSRITTRKQSSSKKTDSGMSDRESSVSNASTPTQRRTRQSSKNQSEQTNAADDAKQQQSTSTNPVSTSTTNRRLTKHQKSVTEQALKEKPRKKK